LEGLTWTIQFSYQLTTNKTSGIYFDTRITLAFHLLIRDKAKTFKDSYLNILFVHQNFPGQYKHLAPALSAKGHRVVALGIGDRKIEGVEYFHYRPKRGTSEKTHPWVTDFEAKVIRAEACANACNELKHRGFEPDVICVHPGWGEALLLREVWPDAKQLHFVEFFYGSIGRDVGFDPEFPSPEFSGNCRLRIKNTNNLLNLFDMDQGISPTQWQKSTVPEQFRDKIVVIHDGIDTARLSPDPSAVMNATNDRGENISLSSSQRVITFINRNLEPSRGYHQFMRALPHIFRQDPEVQVVIIGGDGVSYGAAPEKGSWKQQYLDEVRDKIELKRVHFLGKVSYDTFIKAMQISSAHVYLTYPFVLSWSMLEAMSLGAPLVGSRTPPVEEIIKEGINGRLVDFFSPEEIARVSLEVANSENSKMRAKARQTIVDHYDLNATCLPQQIALIENLATAK